MKLIKITNLSKTYHTKEKEILSIDDISLDINEAEIISIVGPSGCGKSTLLNILTNLEKPSKGNFHTYKPLIIGYMMQNDALLSWKTVRDNALLGLKLKNMLNKENIQYVDNLLKKYDLYDFKDNYPDSLSGGMRQRLALIRTLAIKPNILLLDEPFSKLDIDSRITISDDVYKIIKELNITTILISHDIAEAISLSNRIVILTKRPAKIKDIISIDLNKYSSPSLKRQTDEFNKLYNIIWSKIDHV